MLSILLVFLVAMVAFLAAGMVLGRHRWNSETRKLRARMEAARMPVRPERVDFTELEGLPVPVQRFFRTALTEGQPMIAGARMRHRGTLDLGEATDRWKGFTSDQRVFAQRPGFDWNGRIAMVRGFPIRVHDSYIEGEGLLHASIFGLLPLARVQGTDDMAESELTRFFAEAAWYPTVLLPSQGVRWEPVDDRSAYATLTDGSVAATLLFTFDKSGLVGAVRTEARGRMVSGKIVQTPWEGRFWNYSERSGMRVPLDGEVAWLLSSGPKPYWRGHIMEIEFDFTR